MFAQQCLLFASEASTFSMALTAGAVLFVTALIRRGRSAVAVAPAEPVTIAGLETCAPAAAAEHRLAA